MPGIASSLGQIIRHIRPGLSMAATARHGLRTMTLQSAAFDDHGTIPVRYTADGAGLSPPLHWSGLPEGTASIALLVEDVDAPFPQPLVHLLLHALPPMLNGLAEGAVPRDMARSRMFTAGRNSVRPAWVVAAQPGAGAWAAPVCVPDPGTVRAVCAEAGRGAGGVADGDAGRFARAWAVGGDLRTDLRRNGRSLLLLNPSWEEMAGGRGATDTCVGSKERSKRSQVHAVATPPPPPHKRRGEEGDAFRP